MSFGQSCWTAVMNMSDLCRNPSVVLSCTAAAELWVCFTPYSQQSNARSHRQHPLSMRIREHVWQGNKKLLLYLFSLILTSSHSSIYGEKLRWRNLSVSCWNSLLFLLCPCVTPPLSNIWRPGELCVHFDLSVTTSQAFWPLVFYIYMVLVLHLLPNHKAVVWDFIPFSLHPPPFQVMEFYNSEQRTELWELSGSPDHMWPQPRELVWSFSWPSLKVVLTRVRINIMVCCTAFSFMPFGNYP